jgi:Leucine-rich repeat (LRR) protein
VIRVVVTASLMLALTPARAAPPPLADESKMVCDWARCTLDVVTDKAKAIIEQRKERDATIIDFRTRTTDARLRSVSRLPWAQRVDLPGDAITSLEPLRELKELRELYLPDAKVSLTPLAKLAKLEWLILGSTPLDLKPLAHSRSLRSLSVRFRLDVAVLGSLTGLTELRVRDAFDEGKSFTATDAPALSKLTRLQQLFLLGTGLTDTKTLASLRELKVLDLSGNKKLVDVSGLRGLPKLTRLDLRRTAVADVAPLATLPALESLDLRDTAVGDLSPLVPLAKRLKYLGAPKAAASLPIMAQLQKLNPSLRIEAGE